MNYKTIASFVWYFIWKPLAQTLLIIFTTLFIDLNPVSLTLNVLIWVLIFKTFNKETDMREWFTKTIPITSAVVLGFYYLFVWLGAFGLLGLLVIGLLLAGLRIYQGWALFDELTTWGAKKLRGKTSDGFDFENVKKRMEDKKIK